MSEGNFWCKSERYPTFQSYLDGKRSATVQRESVGFWRESVTRNMWIVCATDRPTFYLNGDIQGFSEKSGAIRTACEITGLSAEMIHVERY